MITVEYLAQGQKFGDVEARDYAHYIATKSKPDASWIISTSNVFEYLRLEIKHGNIDCETICFVYEGEQIPIDHNGMVQHWPKGFCDWQMDVITELVG